MWEFVFAQNPGFFWASSEVRSRAKWRVRLEGEGKEVSGYLVGSGVGMCPRWRGSVTDCCVTSVSSATFSGPQCLAQNNKGIGRPNATISKFASHDYRFSLNFGQGVSQQRDR